MRYLGAAAVILTLFSAWKVSMKSNEVDIAEDISDESDIRPRKRNLKKSSQTSPGRLPASVSSNQGATFGSQDRSSNYAGQELSNDEWKPEPEPTQAAASPMSYDNSAPDYSPRSSENDRTPSSSKSKSETPSTSSASNGSFIGGGSLPPAAPVQTPTSSSSKDSDSDESDTSAALTCESSIGAGSFSRPISLGITCSAAADIKYCVSEGSCCDPSSGSSYSAPFVVGALPKTYCVSYLGTPTGSGDDSQVYQSTYTFSSEVPHLLVTHQKTFLQTTQLEETMLFSSNNFGSSEHEMSLMNLIADPGATTCEDISEFASSDFQYIMPRTNSSSQTPGSEITIGLNTSSLRYGDNWLTSMMKGLTYEDSAVACSTRKITLEDFDFFELSASNSSVPAGDVREFVGGFSDVGFFEDETQVVAREPAGESVEDQGSQELRNGFLGIFYF